MAVGILIPEFPTQTHIFFWREVAALRGMGVEVRLLSTRRPRASCPHEFASGAEQETHYLYPPRLATALATLAQRPIRTLRGVQYLLTLRQTPWRQRIRNLGLLACAADLLAHARSTDIRHIHVHSCADAAHVGVLCRILGGPPYSLMLHGDLVVYGQDHARKMARAACVTAAGQPLKEQIVAQVGYPAERIMASFMGVDTAHFRDDGERSPDGERVQLVTVGRLHPCKGHRFALAALRNAVDLGANLSYTLIGEGAERPVIEADIRRLGLTDRVELRGMCSEQTVLDVLQHADVLVMPSVGLGESHTVAIMEAMSCGLPVISSIIGSTAEMIRDGVDGFLVEQEDVAGLSRAFVTLANDSALRRRMGAAARQRAVARFDVRDVTSRVWQFIGANSDASLAGSLATLRTSPDVRQPAL